MPGKVILLLPAFLLLAGYGFCRPGNPSNPVVNTYKKAERFFNSDNPTAVTDSMALAGFEEVIRQLQTSHAKQYDTLLFKSYLNKGVLLDVINNNDAAKDAYLKAVQVQHNNRLLSDSLLFKPYIYAGSNYFNLNNFDSANYFLIKAEALLTRFPLMPETERLYNTLGALHYVNGNYLQSKNYFSLALEFIKNRRPYDRVFALGLQANIASSYYKLGSFSESLLLYNKIIKQKISAGYIYEGICMNMGKAYTALKKFEDAIGCYKKIVPASTPSVLNELAHTYYELNQFDSARYYLDQLQKLNKKSKVNILDLGINNFYRAEMLADQQQYLTALAGLQKTIVIFAGNFNNNDIYANPGNFTGSYTYYRLFDALYKKAQLFALLYRNKPREQYLAASLDTYKAAITLLNFIEKSYDTDDAKLFLKKKSQDVYSDALQVCLQLNQLKPGGHYLEEAFMISEKNKASVMAANLRQKNMATLPGTDQSFLQTERNIKFAIARLDIKSEQTSSNEEIKKLAKEKAGYEIELSRLQKNLEQNNHFFKLKYEEDYQTASGLRKQLKPGQALFSFYFTKNTLHVFSFTASSFKYVCIDNADSLQQDAGQWINNLKTAGDGRRFSAGVLGARLYTRLIKPMQLLAPGKDEWIIIPDGDLYLLPFESLPGGTNDKTLLETTTISYQFSSRFITNTSAHKKNNEPVNVLSFAPFAQQGAAYHQPGFDFINRLPASAEEIAALTGRAYINGQATKTMFLQQAANYPVIHLATHAIADVKNPAASFIAFYPDKKLPSENCLYLEEIYGLNMDACQLVVISACETGKGELVNNEGIMSLGRAFAYAGCGATINSLWKADDKATAAILKNFHVYLEQGYTKARALQKAKLDYINSDALYKSPAYWSNLILTGNEAPVYKKKSSFLWMIATATGCLLIAGLIMKRQKKKSTLFTTI